MLCKTPVPSDRETCTPPLHPCPDHSVSVVYHLQYHSLHAAGPPLATDAHPTGCKFVITITLMGSKMSHSHVLNTRAITGRQNVSLPCPTLYGDNSKMYHYLVPLYGDNSKMSHSHVLNTRAITRRQNVSLPCPTLYGDNCKMYHCLVPHCMGITVKCIIALSHCMGITVKCIIALSHCMGITVKCIIALSHTVW